MHLNDKLIVCHYAEKNLLNSSLLIRILNKDQLILRFSANIKSGSLEYAKQREKEIQERCKWISREQQRAYDDKLYDALQNANLRYKQKIAEYRNEQEKRNRIRN